MYLSSIRVKENSVIYMISYKLPLDLQKKKIVAYKLVS